jgi:hypothetical protein
MGKVRVPDDPSHDHIRSLDLGYGASGEGGGMRGRTSFQGKSARSEKSGEDWDGEDEGEGKEKKKSALKWVANGFKVSQVSVSRAWMGTDEMDTGRVQESWVVESKAQAQDDAVGGGL